MASRLPILIVYDRRTKFASYSLFKFWNKCCLSLALSLYHYIIIYDCIIIIVDEMIAEVDIDGDGRIDFEGKFTTINSYG